MKQTATKTSSIKDTTIEKDSNGNLINKESPADQKFYDFYLGRVIN